MLKSRRGLLAVGLAAVVIGSIGVVSTLNAGAEQIPASPAPAMAPSGASAADPAPALTPPPKLPWGQSPEEIRTGQDGASSGALKAAGLDAAAPDTSGAEAGEEYAPKGRSSRSTFLKSETTTVVPPEPPGTTTEPAADTSKPTVHFLYNVGSQAAVSEGAYANLTINKPKLDRADYHTLAELAVQSADGAQIVEVGWNVDRVVNGDDDPHLFVFHWADRKSTCYNGCGFVQFSENIRPGDTLPQDTAKRFGLQYFNKAWWVAYDTEWVGYFPAALWTVDFSKSGLVQVFGEVAAATDKPCTQMGNGRAGDDLTSARIGSMAFVNGPPADMFVRSTSDIYSALKLSARTFRYGGPGACEA